MSVHVNHKTSITKKQPFTFLFNVKPRQKRRAICGMLKFIENILWKKNLWKEIEMKILFSIEIICINFLRDIRGIAFFPVI